MCIMGSEWDRLAAEFETNLETPQYFFDKLRTEPEFCGSPLAVIDKWGPEGGPPSGSLRAPPDDASKVAKLQQELDRVKKDLEMYKKKCAFLEEQLNVLLGDPLPSRD